MAPYKSQAQQRYFHYLESKGKMPKKTVHEFDAATDFENLPEHVKKMYEGGELPEYNFDEETGGAEDFDSSGEPHENDEFKKMANGGVVHRAMFARAIGRKK